MHMHTVYSYELVVLLLEYEYKIWVEYSIDG